MSGPSLRELERDVEQTRGRLARNLATLRSPATFSEFTDDLKQEALDTKDALLEKARDTAQSTAQSFLDDLKARAAANPAAALAIGAGIAWRLLRHPPIATALVGAGLYSLFRSTPVTTGATDAEYLATAKRNLQDQARDLAAEAKTRVVDAAAEAARRGKDMASEAGRRASEVAADAKDRITDLGRTARETAQEWGSAAKDQADQMTARLADEVPLVPKHGYDSAADVAARARGWAAAAANAAPEDTRNKVLLGVAGLAVAAALSMAYQRRSEETAE